METRQQHLPGCHSQQRAGVQAYYQRLKIRLFCLFTLTLHSTRPCIIQMVATSKFIVCSKHEHVRAQQQSSTWRCFTVAWFSGGQRQHRQLPPTPSWWGDPRDG
ncbi:hypothetical protein E2C01_028593 [Portunus trituberculatus]|uniref:Uncharacterized protein n=1 Tax=Portunus trituberculatus TaxID=210409 RepID=A0A5B7EP63_PORTR|nr:hypothetical protein [Portunus trituberculatus]